MISRGQLCTGPERYFPADRRRKIVEQLFCLIGDGPPITKVSCARSGNAPRVPMDETRTRGF
ncbi:hypothetical protein BURKHO8Y_140029 [Burkholderia sp. 8Y]|nr:hypothetical protein BURKHO8Y_140029 [Burkholderia sp. 8Y]